MRFQAGETIEQIALKHVAGKSIRLQTVIGYLLKALNRQLMLDTAELGQRLSRAESELAQEHVDREQERRQAAHQNKELRKALREVRDIVRASIASMRGDPPSVTGQHTASKKRPRDEDEDDRVGLQELVDSLMA